MKIAAIIPVKTFSNAKTRINLDSKQRKKICEIMLNEVLQTIFQSGIFEKIIIVSKDKNAFKIGKKYNAIEIYDKNESGVNNAVSLADVFIEKHDFDATIVFPQDIPIIQTDDILHLANFLTESNSVIIIPSRRFDGTNALLRSPGNIMKTHYDEDSYKIHLSVGKSISKKTSLAFIRRIMFDIDNNEDLELLLSQNEKPELCSQILKVVSKN